MAPPKTVFCSCTICSKHETSINGTPVKGREISVSARSKHHKRAQSATDGSESEEQLPRPSKKRRKGRQDDFPTAAQRYEDALDVADVEVSVALVERMVGFLAMWLNLKGNLSRSATNILLVAISFILATVAILFATLLSAALGVKVDPITFKIPRDIRTTFSHSSLNPVIQRVACCPKCFKLYTLDRRFRLPKHCTSKKTKLSRACGAPLTSQRKTRKGYRAVPRRIFNTQLLDAWLKYFLARPGIEESFTDSYATPLRAEGGWMRSIWSSPAWHSFESFTRRQGNLTFSLYIDWFNPLGNKKGGKDSHSGAIIMCCMNLPPDLRFRPENTFVVGITPGPNEPDVEAIAHLLRPLITYLQQYFSEGISIITPNHPDGFIWKVAILPLLGDLPAIRKLTGWLSHSAHRFCPWCSVTSDKVGRLDYGKWRRRSPEKARKYMWKWKQAKTKVAREEIQRKKGVRYTPLVELPYWDPIASLVLGFMHAWLEGVLSDHLRICWAVGLPKKEADAEKQQAQSAREEDTLEMDEGREVDLDSELEEIVSESRESANSSRSVTPFLPVSNGGLHEAMNVDRLSAPSLSRESSQRASSDGDIEMAEAESPVVSESDDDLDWTSDDTWSDETNFKFSKDQMSKVWSAIAKIERPTFAGSLPSNLGEKTHGSLRANDFLILFTDIFPLVIPELWWMGSNDEQLMLDNLHDLVAATHIVASFATCDAEADRFLQHFIAYMKSCRKLYFRFHPRPNHHYSCHFCELLKHWGPMGALNEFYGERLNGMLAGIKINDRVYDWDYTMLVQICRRSKLEAQRDDAEKAEPVPGKDESMFREYLKGFQPLEKSIHRPHLPLDPSQEAEILKRGKNIPNIDYTRILSHLTLSGVPWRHCGSFPHPNGALVLPPRAKSVTEVKLEDQNRVFSCYSSHPGNSAIRFHPGGQYRHIVRQGFIRRIYRLPLFQNLRTFLVVQLHRRLSPEDEARGPYHQYPHFRTTIFSAQPSDNSESWLVIEPEHIISHEVVYRCPKGIYDISEDFLLVCDSVNRGRWE